MRRIAGWTAVVGLAAAMLLVPTAATAQDDQGGGRGMRGQRGQRGQRGDFDPAQFRERMLDRYQERLGMADDEWTAVKPLLSDVMEKQQAARMGGGRGMFGFGGRGGRGGPRGGDDAAAADNPAAQLSQALEDENTPASEITAKLKALRDARKKAEEELKASRDKLRKVCTVRQEAQLVLMGMLD